MACITFHVMALAEMGCWTDGWMDGWLENI